MLATHETTKRAGSFNQLQQLPDTLAFLQLLADLDSAPVGSSATAAAVNGSNSDLLASPLKPTRAAGGDAGGGSGSWGSSSGGGAAVADAELPERRAARGLFR
jgi:hypothetical protein